MTDEPYHLPPSLKSAIEAPPVPVKPWQDGVAPAFIALVLSVVFLDRLAPTTLFVGGLAPASVGAALAGLLAYWCLYCAPATWGAATKRPLAVVATSTFGARGATWVPGLLLGVVYVIWFAITIDYATEYSLSGLVATGLLDAKYLATHARGSIVVPSWLFLVVAAAWSLASAVIGTIAVRLVAAVMSVYPIFPAIAIGLTVLWAIPTVGAGPVATRPLAAGGGQAISTMIQLVFAFLACHGLAAADWGAATPSTREARLGGLVGVMLAAPILAILALLIVAGALGRTATPAPIFPDPLGPISRPTIERRVPLRATYPTTNQAAEPGITTLREVYLRGIGGRLGAAGLFVLALGLLGPACSTPYVIARQLSAIWPRPPRWLWSVLGAIATWPLIATGVARNLEFLFGVIGGLTAPAVGAIAADYSRTRGRWPGPRRGVNWAGMIAWFLGVLSVPWISFAGGLSIWAKLAPSALVSYGIAFLGYRILAAAGMEPRAVTAPEVERLTEPS
ncbi:MAG: purine-cytosine permease-like transporter [Planctomycetota bacterium]|nr:purine-cytosine permease-like transporter [Planctomycetota bacterium]